MKNTFKLLLGTISGLFVSLLFGCFIFKYLTGISPIENLNIIKYGTLSGRALSLGAIPNIGLFYLFLNKENYFSARGVILSFIVIALFVLFA